MFLGRLAAGTLLILRTRAWAEHSEVRTPQHRPLLDILVRRILREGKLQATPLTADQPYTSLTRWSILDALTELAAGFTSLGPFTLGLLTHYEVLAVNQNAIGTAGSPRRSTRRP